MGYDKNFIVTTGVLKNDVKCIGGNFLKGEWVKLLALPFGDFEITSLDGKKCGYAADFEVEAEVEVRIQW